MFKDILVPIDYSYHSEIALVHAASVARALNSRLILLHVVDLVSTAGSAFFVNPLDWQLWKAEAKVYLQDRVQRLQESGLDAEWHVLEGDAAKRIIEFTYDHAVDLVVVNARGQSAAQGWNLGGVAQKIAQHVRASILVVRSDDTHADQFTSPQEVKYQRIYAPLDCSQRAECVLPVAAALSMKHDGRLFLLHVVQPPEIPRRMPLTQEEVQLADAIVQRNQQEAESYLAELQSRLPCSVDTRVVVGAHVGATLQQLALQEHADLVVLSAHGYSSEPSTTFGSQAIHFLAHGTTSLLVVKDTPA